MFTKKILGASILAALALATPGCLQSADDELDNETVAHEDDGVATPASVIGTLGGVVGQLDSTNQAIKSENTLAVIASLAGFASFFPAPDSYAEISPAQIDQIATETANKVISQIDRGNMETYVANSKTDIKAVLSQLTAFSCTPGAPIKNNVGTVIKPHCTSAQLTNPYTTANTLFTELGNDWSNLTSLRRHSPALAMMAAKSIILVGAARINLDHRLQLLDQMTNLTSSYESTTNKATFKVQFKPLTNTYRAEVKAEMGGLASQFEPALDGIFKTQIVVKDTGYQQKTKYGCVYDQAGKETCDTNSDHTDYWDCDWELGCSWANSVSDQELTNFANQAKEGLKNNIRAAKGKEWLGIGAGFWAQYQKL